VAVEREQKETAKQKKPSEFAGFFMSGTLQEGHCHPAKRRNPKEKHHHA
jgi:hypothetical protein